MNFPEQDLASVAAGMICFRVISRFASFPTFPLSSCLLACLPASNPWQTSASALELFKVSPPKIENVLLLKKEKVEDYDEFEEEDDYCLFLRIVVG